MSPYQQAVTDIEKREATKQFESQVVPELAAKAAMAQPFGGSRQAILRRYGCRYTTKITR